MEKLGTGERTMEREQIIKALECLTGEEVMFCRECGYNRVGAFSCRKELAKDALSLIKELTEENERLRNRITATIILTDKDAEKIKNECIERIELDIKAIEADTVWKYREKLYRELASLGVKDKFNKEFFLTKADQVAKEMLEKIK